MPEISVIVPVYKVEPYLRRCVDSILAQTFTDFELILVDDGSPDNCPAICDEYAAHDNRICVIHQTNAGQAAATNVGIRAASGEWLLFCDADDYYNNDLLSEYLKQIDLQQTENLYAFSYFDVWPSGISEEIKYKSRVLDNIGYKDKMYLLSSCLSHQMMGFAKWDKLYSRKIIDQYNILEVERENVNNGDDWAEDLAFNLQYMICVDRIIVSDSPVYLLRKHGTPAEQNENGLIGRINHMLKLFQFVRNSPAYNDDILQKDYWKIVIWHMHRYFYLEAAASGVSELRKTVQKCENTNITEYISLAVRNWKTYGTRWDNVKSKDYYYLLCYLLDGNMLKYRLRNYWLWKIRPLVLKDGKQ